MKAIFTLIQYRWGGDRHPSDRGQDVAESDLRISTWGERDADICAREIAEAWAKQHYIGGYEFDRFTLLINGVHVNQTQGDDIWDYYYLPSNSDGEATPEELEHDAFVEEFWAEVVEMKDKLVAARKAKKLVEEQERAEEQRKKQIALQQQQEAAERAQLQTLLAKYGN